MEKFTLLLTMHAPMQAWVNEESRFNDKYALDHVTKSGLIGMIAACQGRERGSDLSDLAALPYGVRIDNPYMVLEYDYQVTRTMMKCKGNWERKSTVSTRYYYADAMFVSGIESSDKDVLDQITYDIQNYRYAPYFGRRYCQPSSPLLPRIRQSDLYTALSEEPWSASEYMQEVIIQKHLKNTKAGEPLRLRILTECQSSEADYMDMTYPISFSRECRRYAYSCLKEAEPKIISPDVPIRAKMSHIGGTQKSDVDFWSDSYEMSVHSQRKSTRKSPERSIDFFEEAKRGF